MVNESTSENRLFLGMTVWVIIIGALAAVLVSPVVNRDRHQSAQAFLSRGAKQSGPARVEWDELAHVISPNDPATGLQLAQAQLTIGSATDATATLSHYQQYAPAVVL